MRAARHTAALALAGALAAGCVVHLERNAPGIVDVRRPPPPRGRLAQPVQAEPQDPGERLLVLLPGGFVAGGPLVTGHGTRGVGLAGGELTAIYGTRARSHQQPTLLLPVGLLPQHGFGGSFGVGAFFDDDRARLGPLYVEGQYAYLGLFTAAAGYAWDPSQGGHGPQISLSAAGLYARTTILAGQGTTFLFGIVLKLPVTVVWSR